MHKLQRTLLLTILLLASPAALAGASATWRVSLESGPLGPVEFYLETTLDGDELRGVSHSGAVELLRKIPGERSIDDGLFAFSAARGDDGQYAGDIVAPWQDGTITIGVDGEQISGSIDGGIFAGSFNGVPADQVISLRDYQAVLEAFDSVVANKVFAPGDLEQPAYLEFREQLGRVADKAIDDLDLLFGFRWLWRNEPFSHFRLQRSAQTAEQMFTFFDQYRVGFEAATVDFDDDIAVLKVRTMMGADTIEQIQAAYARIAKERPAALVIDLRGNGGGAFAVKPLVEHVIDEPLDAGFFISQVWNREHDDPPTATQALAAPLWQGWSIIGFWKAVQETDIVRVQFQPAEPNYDGPVYVLLDERSASATEMAADALRSSGVTTLVGRRSAGEMLSQSMFDVADGFIVSLPVADYYSVTHGRIEGVGVPVDIESEPGQALDVAIELARNRSSGAD
ncbi:MAG: S41 family peptidase [Woeseiaceae bacterium]|nr:S41 family peptidase [Woeseiaceae bacterium]